MKRHPSLVPLSHDHHHALAAAEQLRRVTSVAESREDAAAFLDFFAAAQARHFREEEELLFPLVAELDEAREPLLQALLEHQRVRALARRLEAGLAEGEPGADVMRELGDLLVAHVRHEERVLFPLIERLADESALASLELPVRDATRWREH